MINYYERRHGMTQKLYNEDAYIKEFDAEVVSCLQNKDRYLVTLDKSAFFPEGGGQSGDRGTLILKDHSTVKVLDTHEKDGNVIVYCESPIAAGESVHGILDWEFRFDRMQNHSGEHIVSGLIHERFGYNNVGFHMSSDRMTIDLDGEISQDEIDEIERKANEIVWADSVVRTDVYTEEEAEKIEFRSKKELKGEIRVVSIPGADVCACCGTHVRRTGEIGLIKIISHVRFKGGVRMEMMCGRWAYEYMAQIFRQNHEVSMHLSSRMHETGNAALKLVEDNSRLKGRLIGMVYEQIDRKAEALTGAGNVLIFAPEGDSVTAQKLAAKVMETCGGTAFSFAGTDEEGYKYAVGLKDGDLKTVVKSMNAALEGRGGGKPFFQQGSVNAGKERIVSFLQNNYPQLVIDTL